MVGKGPDYIVSMCLCGLWSIFPAVPTLHNIHPENYDCNVQENVVTP